MCSHPDYGSGIICIHLCFDVCVQRSNGIRFIRLHIPWPILSREAELQKIKVAVKKVSGFTLEKWWLDHTCFAFLFSSCGTFQSLKLMTYIWSTRSNCFVLGAELWAAEADRHRWDLGFLRNQSQHPISARHTWRWHSQRFRDPNPFQNP